MLGWREGGAAQVARPPVAHHIAGPLRERVTDCTWCRRVVERSVSSDRELRERLPCQLSASNPRILRLPVTPVTIAFNPARGSPMHDAMLINETRLHAAQCRLPSQCCAFCIAIRVPRCPCRPDPPHEGDLQQLRRGERVGERMVALPSGEPEVAEPIVERPALGSRVQRRQQKGEVDPRMMERSPRIDRMPRSIIVRSNSARNATSGDCREIEKREHPGTGSTPESCVCPPIRCTRMLASRSPCPAAAPFRSSRRARYDCAPPRRRRWR